MKKKIISLILALLMCLAITSPALAYSLDSTGNPTDGENGEIYLEGYLLLEDGIARRITQAELDEIFVTDLVEQNFTQANDSAQELRDSNFADMCIYKNVKTVKTAIYKSLSAPVSSWTEFGPQGGNFTVAESKSFGRSYSLSADAPLKSGVSAKIGAEWSYSNSTTVSSQLNATPNTTARLRFAPECVEYFGQLERRKWNYDFVSENDLTVYQPTNKLNGLFYIEYQ